MTNSQVARARRDNSAPSPHELVGADVPKPTHVGARLVATAIHRAPAKDPKILPKKSGDSQHVLYESAKRGLDIVLGTVLLIVSAPIILIAAAAIRLESTGSPFFIQTRLGKNGHPFRIFKLRGMFKDARIRFPSYYDYSNKRDLDFCFHHQDDPRVTRAGNFIRKTSIDELPNLWNVVRGDISLVGPRPE